MEVSRHAAHNTLYVECWDLDHPWHNIHPHTYSTYKVNTTYNASTECLMCFFQQKLWDQKTIHSTVMPGWDGSRCVHFVLDEDEACETLRKYIQKTKIEDVITHHIAVRSMGRALVDHDA